MSSYRLFDGFRITRAEIARGGSGIVHEALSPEGCKVAIKVLDRELLMEKLANLITSQKPHLAAAEVLEETRRSYESNVDRFKAEYQVLTKLDHQNVAKVYKIGFFEDHYYIVYEFIEGKPIVEYVRLWKPVDMTPLFLQAFEGFDYIHRNGLIHLDVKSDNILVHEVDGKPQVKIIDFGLAMTPDEYGGQFVGTVETVAPEIVLGWKVDARADLFSLGVEWYRSITWGQPPYPRTNQKDRTLIRRAIEREATLRRRPPSSVHRHRPGYVPEYLDTIVMRLIAYKPEDRFYGNARAVINAVLTHEPDLFGEDVAEKSAYLIPEGNRHIGCDDEMKSVVDTINMLAEGKQPKPGIFWIRGEQGTGKTHFLQKIKESAEQHVEKISIVFVASPVIPSEAEGSLAVSASRSDAAISNFDESTIDTLADMKPTVVLIDDVEDENVLAPYVRLLQQPDPSPLWLCFASDNDDQLLLRGGLQGSSEVERVKSINLHPFTRDQLAEYLNSTPALKGKELPQKWVDTLYTRTNGIPAEVQEYLTQLDDHSFLFGLDGEIILSSVTPIEFEMSLSFRSGKLKTTQQRLLSIYMSLNHFEREVVDLLAVWNWQNLLPPPTIDDLSRLIPNSWLPQTLNALEQQGVIVCHPERMGTDPEGACPRSEGSRFSFTNDLMPGFIMGRIYEETRRELHDGIAAYLDNKDDIAAIHRAYGNETKSWKVIRDALVAAKRYAFKEGRLGVGEIVLQRLLELITAYPNPRVLGDDSCSGLPPVKRFTGHHLTIYIMLMLIDVCYRQGKFQGAQAIYERAAKKVALLNKTRRTYSIRLSLRIIPVFTAMKEYEKAAEVISHAKELHGADTNVPTWPALLNYEARMYYDRRNESSEYLSKARMLYEQSEVFEESLPERSRERITNNDLGTLLFSLGEYERAIPELDRKYQRDSKLGHTYNAARTTFVISEAYRMQRKYDDAEKYAKRAYDLANASNESRMLVYAHQVMAKLFHDMDRFDEAMREYRKWLTASSFLDNEKEYRRASIAVWLHMGHCFKELHKWNDSLLQLEAVLASKPEDLFTPMSAHIGIGEVSYRIGDSEKSLKHLKMAEDILQSIPDDQSRPYQYRIGITYAEIYLNKNEHIEAKVALENIREIAKENDGWLKEYENLRVQLPA